mmetsp:Transcript_121521/g.388787  ORF Transcript_121521/g.388787 Transcript_121521/m.388787 type:complete len:227 (-) Transcript_121521:416-1096(-)
MPTAWEQSCSSASIAAILELICDHSLSRSNASKCVKPPRLRTSAAVGAAQRDAARAQSVACKGRNSRRSMHREESFNKARASTGPYDTWAALVSGIFCARVAMSRTMASNLTTTASASRTSGCSGRCATQSACSTRRWLCSASAPSATHRAKEVGMSGSASKVFTASAPPSRSGPKGSPEASPSEPSKSGKSNRVSSKAALGRRCCAKAASSDPSAGASPDGTRCP